MSEYGDAKRKGATITWGGPYVPRDKLPAPTLDSFLPYAARSRITPLRGDFVPEATHGMSLFHICEVTCWDSIRTSVFATRGNRCEICGIDGVLECHEVWGYSVLDKTNGRGQSLGIQRLLNLWSLCPACHKMFHLGLASVQGLFEEAADRLALVNRWSLAQLESYVAWQIALREYRADVMWTLDLSFINGYGPLVLKPGASIICGRKDGAIVSVDYKLIKIYGTRLVL